jgi:hypothetical protein
LGNHAELEAVQLKWRGREPAVKLYKGLRSKALAANPRIGSEVEANKEWAHQRSGIVDKMIHEWKTFKV